MILGIDGCSSGWVCALGAIENTQLKVIELRFAYHPDEIWTPAIKKICIDMPIGLPNISKKGGRVSDVIARKILGKKGSSRVFSPPIRQVLFSQDYQKALEISRMTEPDGVGLSKQSFYLLPKIRQIDAWLQVNPERQKDVFETHPELSFWAMGHKTAPSKHTSEGIDHRIQLLCQEGIWNDAYLDIIPIEKSKGNMISKDDVLDALACMWSAHRCLIGTEQRIPTNGVFVDDVGFLMRYVF